MAPSGVRIVLGGCLVPLALQVTGCGGQTTAGEIGHSVHYREPQSGEDAGARRADAGTVHTVAEESPTLSLDAATSPTLTATASDSDAHAFTGLDEGDESASADAGSSRDVASLEEGTPTAPTLPSADDAPTSDLEPTFPLDAGVSVTSIVGASDAGGPDVTVRPPSTLTEESNETLDEEHALSCPEVPEIPDAGAVPVSKFANFSFHNMRFIERFVGIVEFASNVSATFGVTVGASPPSVAYRECEDVVLDACVLTVCHDLNPEPVPAEDYPTHFTLPVAAIDVGGDPVPLLDPVSEMFTYSAPAARGSGEPTRIRVQGACGVPDFDFDYQPANIVTLSSPYLSWSSQQLATTRDLEVAWSNGGVGTVSFMLADGDTQRHVQCTAPSSDGGLTVDVSLFSDFTGVGSASVSSSSTLRGNQDDWSYSATSQSYIAGDVEFVAN